MINRHLPNLRKHFFLYLVIEPGQDMRSYGHGVGGGDADLAGENNSGNNLQPVPDGTFISSQQQQGGSIPPINTWDPAHGGPFLRKFGKIIY